MDLVSLRILTDDLDRMVAFYERVLGLTASRPAPVFAEFRTGRGTLAIGATQTVNGFAPDAVTPGVNRSVIVEFLVDDVDALRAGLDEVVLEPTTMPWGNRSTLVRDPDGNLVNFFTPVTPEAVARAQG